MAVNTNISVPFIPQEGVTNSILAAIQQANQEHIQRMQLANQQQALQSQIGLQRAQTAGTEATTAKTQQETAANLPAIQAQAEQARTNYTNIQSQVEQEQNPLKKAVLQGQARQANADASLAEARAAMFQNTTGSDFNSTVDKAIDPKKYPELNKRTHAAVDAASKLAILDPEGPTRALASGISEINEIERETDPNVIQARIDQAVREHRALYGGGAVSGVAPNLVPAATADANKADDDFAQAATVAQRLSAMVNAAKSGNVVAYQLIPQEGALQVTTSQGVHRINMAEIQNYGGGSLFQQLEGHLGKSLTGQSIPPSVLNDMVQMQKVQMDGARSKYEQRLTQINKRYGSAFQPVDAPDTPAQAETPTHSPGGAATGLTEGQTGTGSDGKKYVVKGGKWVAQ